MFNSLTLENFKGFSKPNAMKLAPITLIYGPNSSGKSSIIQALMLLKQSITRPSENGGLASTGEYVDLGTYSSMVNNHDTNRDIKFSVEYKPCHSVSNGFSLGSFFGNSHNRTHDFIYSLSGKECKNKNESFTYLKKISSKVTSKGNKNPTLDLDLVSDLANNESGNFIKRVVRARTYRFSSSAARE